MDTKEPWHFGLMREYFLVKQERDRCRDRERRWMKFAHEVIKKEPCGSEVCDLAGELFNEVMSDPDYMAKEG